MHEESLPTERKGARDPEVYLDHSNVAEQCWTHCMDYAVEVSLSSSTAMSEHGSRIALTKFPRFKHVAKGVYLLVLLKMTSYRRSTAYSEAIMANWPR